MAQVFISYKDSSGKPELPKRIEFTPTIKWKPSTNRVRLDSNFSIAKLKK